MYLFHLLKILTTTTLAKYATNLAKKADNVNQSSTNPSSIDVNEYTIGTQLQSLTPSSKMLNHICTYDSMIRHFIQLFVEIAS